MSKTKLTLTRRFPEYSGGSLKFKNSSLGFHGGFMGFRGISTGLRKLEEMFTCLRSFQKCIRGVVQGDHRHYSEKQWALMGILGWFLGIFKGLSGGFM